ncbi:PilZ domain-containing protein [Qipengyuania oceanensis]|uniref:PilZ domain-containing protein n=1 Tax=Qipengyuania oceanensis TaxID=1463597 RepID=A0A844YG81_9SPHN|nr:PilZ domain-containing protein [Qipengyuania oceanensis]MXO62947.1 PilZ domain-containing protein [Qipengyuania oceanensis]
MDYFSTEQAAGKSEHTGEDRRGSARYTSLIRAAKIVSDQGEFVCVIRDVSETGISLRTFHSLPRADRQELVLQNGMRYELDKVRAKDGEASFTFADTVDVQQLIVETGKYPKRQLRISVSIPATVSTLTQRLNAVIHNVSQQGALLECDALLAIEQPIRLEAREFPEVRAKVRWRREENYGLAFDDTFSLRDFALKAAALQCPALLGR